QVGWPEDSPAWYARQDAEGFAESLIKNFDFPSANVTMLLDEDATRERILSSFLEYVHAHVSHDDRIAVFFAGHGYTKTGHRGEIGYLVPVDGDPSSLSTRFVGTNLHRRGRTSESARRVIPATFIIIRRKV